MPAKAIDPITLQVINGALQTIAEEMGHVLYRMSFSSIIRESQDLGAGLFDTAFNTLCESESTPLHIGSLPGYLAGIRETLQGGEWHDGDVVIHNHPYHGSSHSPDIAVVTPVFYKGELVGFSANTAHHLDIGAATPGLIIDIPDVFAEGMLFAGTKLYERGQRNEALWSYIGRNSRAARQLQNDLDAQIASVRLGVRRFIELMDRYGKQVVLDATQQLMDYTERVLRQRIAAIPDGEYRAEGFLDDDGKNRDVRLPIKVCVRVKGDGIEIDLTGSANQVETAFNVPFEGSTKVACFCAIRSLLLDAETSPVKVPSNQGSFRPVTVVAPKGSIFNPKFPAAAEARFAQCNRVIDLIYKALAPVLPNDIIAGSSASLSFCSYSGVRPSGDYWVFLEVNEGAYGGRPRSDGPDCIDNLMANTRNNPLEDLAMHLPMICDRYELRDDVMPGAGRWRGGIGVVKAQRVLTDAFITHENERHHDVPWGVFRGDPGVVGRVAIYNAARPSEIKEMPAKFSGLRLRANDVHVFYGPCGGGFGDPLQRSAAQVLDDVLDGFCSVEHARAAYGVVVDAAAETVDEVATKALRDKLRAAPRQRQAATAAPTPPASAAGATGRFAFDIVRSTGHRNPVDMVEEVNRMVRSAQERRETATGVPTASVAAVRAVAARPATPAPRIARSAALPIPRPDTGNGAEVSLDHAVRRLHETYGDAWSFEIVQHHAHGSTIEVVGQLRANGSVAREAATAVGGDGRSVGELLERAANESLCRCAQALLRGHSGDGRRRP
jgi:N-methylhydantoinase B